MGELEELRSLASALGVHTQYTDGLGRPVSVAPETLVRVCAAIGAPIDHPSNAREALRAQRETTATRILPPVLVAWDGVLPRLDFTQKSPIHGEILLEDGRVAPLDRPLPLGYHTLTVESSGKAERYAIISAPEHAWRHSDSERSWGVGTHLAALRSSRSRSLGDLRDLEALCHWVRSHGGDLVTLLPLLPTFNEHPTEPSPYSPVSRLFWSELIIDLGNAHEATEPPSSLDVTQADAEVRAALHGVPAPDTSHLDHELVRYARFRGAQARLGRDWRQWPEAAANGKLQPSDIDPDEEQFHLVAQTTARKQLENLRKRLDGTEMRLGLDLAVGVHPDGYDPWSRRQLFAAGMSVGAPPDRGFPSGQDWGFSPVLPEASRHEGHRYLAACVAHQATLSGVLRVDHVMAVTRLYWIPHGLGKHEGTYVSYPSDELFAIMTLESNRNRCEIVGENLGTVPPAINEALPRHRIWGMYLAQFEAAEEEQPGPPGADDVALIGTHDTPTFAGWLAGIDIDERVRTSLLEETAVPPVREARAEAALRLATTLEGSVDEPEALLEKLLDWLGRSPSPLVIPWFEDLWLEDQQVNLPGTRSSERPNWQRPMRRLLDDVFTDAEINELLRRLHEARQRSPPWRAR